MKHIALIGNPNSGKTTLFNQLTGQKAHVGNWPGVTVEVRQAALRNGEGILADLPGLYSLTTYSPEEAVTRTFLLEHQGPVWNLLRPDTIERGLYLTLQLIELGMEVLVVLPWESTQIDAAELSAAVGLPVVTPAKLTHLTNAKTGQAFPRYSRILEGAIAEAASVISALPILGGSLRFWAIACLEGAPPPCSKEQQRRLESIRARLEKRMGEEADTLVAKERYRYVDMILKRVGKTPAVDKKQKADRILLHKFSAIPIFGCIMALLFWVCFGPCGVRLQAWMTALVSALAGQVGRLFTVFDASPAIEGLVQEGIFGGLGTVLCFLPQLALLFMGMTLLEESGYLARAAFLTDRLLRRGGFSGRAFVPLLMGFGCTTSAVLSARTLRGQERENVICLLPFCTCGAKFPLYALLAGSFFPQYSGVMVAGCYLASFMLGLGILFLAGKKRTLTHFILEIPPYQMPSLKRVLGGVWERCEEFLRKAGTIIFAVSLWVWLMGHIKLTPMPVFVPLEESMLMVTANRIVPLFAPLGVESPQAVVALLAGLAGKEAVVSSFGVLCAGTGNLTQALQGIFTPLSALSFLVFFSLYSPCVSALAAIGRELSYRKAIKTALLHTLLAYVCGMAVYWIGGLFIGTVL